MKSPPTIARGRPKSQEKRRLIVEAARDLFLADGYESTSTDAVAELAGVSKATVYNHFSSKLALFEAVVELRSENLQQVEAVSEPSGDVARDMIAIADTLQQMILNSDIRAWDRLVIAETGRHPELAQALFKAGPARVHGLLSGVIKHYRELGQLAVDDIPTAAEHMIGLILGFELVRSQMAQQPKRTNAFWKKRAESAVGVFLARYGSEKGRREQLETSK